MNCNMANMRDYYTELEHINKTIMGFRHAVLKFTGNTLWVFKLIIDDSPGVALEAWVRGKEINIKITDEARMTHRIIALTIPEEYESDTLTIEETPDGILTFSAYNVITPSISAWFLNPDTWSRIPIQKVHIALQSSIGIMLRDGQIRPQPALSGYYNVRHHPF